MNKLKRLLFFGVAIAVLIDLDCVAGDKVQQDFFRWLSPPDPRKNHNVARGSRYSETGAWFINGSTLSEWKASGPTLLWIHGKRKVSLSACSLAH